MFVIVEDTIWASVCRITQLAINANVEIDVTSLTEQSSPSKGIEMYIKTVKKYFGSYYLIRSYGKNVSFTPNASRFHEWDQHSLGVGPAFVRSGANHFSLGVGSAFVRSGTTFLQ